MIEYAKEIFAGMIALLLTMLGVIWVQKRKLDTSEISHLIEEVQELTAIIKELVTEYGEHKTRIVVHTNQINQLELWQQHYRPKLDECFAHVRRADFKVPDRTARTD